MSDDIHLPELPEPDEQSMANYGIKNDCFSWDAMEDYARAAVLADRERRAQPAQVAEAWQRADNPPESEPGKWSRDVIAVTMSGDVFRIAHMGAAGGVWQRTTAMAELGDGGEVVAWIDLPEALIAAHSAGNAQTGEDE